MNAWDKWVKRPQDVWLRKALFQVHLWSGIGLGIYIVIVCLSGSAAVFNGELYGAFLLAPKQVEITGARLSRDELMAAAQRAYPHDTVVRVSRPSDPHDAAVASLGRATYSAQRFIDPYTGKDLGTARPLGLRAVSFFSALHINLLMDRAGRVTNGVGGFLLAALCITGMIIWWPGISRWRDSLTIRKGVRLERLNWDLHSAIGFWSAGLVFMWAITGAYLVFPMPFERALRLIPHTQFINLRLIFRAAHVGDFAGWPVKALWVLLGLIPPALFITGFIMWWCRVLKPWRRRHLARKPVTDGSGNRGALVPGLGD